MTATGARLRLLPCVLLLMLAAACASKPGEPGVPEGAIVTYRAVFIGESNHDTVGTISVYQSEDEAVVVFERNFTAAPLPEAEVALGRDGYVPGTSLGPLRRPQGRQVYVIPERLRIDGYNEVWIWDRVQDRPIGLARLTPIPPGRSI